MFTVQCDFDGTVTVEDVGAAIVRTFASPQWNEVYTAYISGQISVEECGKREYALVSVGPEELEEFVSRTLVVRDGFTQFVDFCRARGVSLVIVSCGLDLYIEPTLKRLGLDGVERYSAKARFTSDGIDIQFIDPWGINRKEGFKSAHLRYLRTKGHPIIYIGDSISDIAPALEADHVVARGGLEEHFRAKSLPCLPFETFHDVIKHIEELMRTGPDAL